MARATWTSWSLPSAARARSSWPERAAPTVCAKYVVAGAYEYRSHGSSASGKRRSAAPFQSRRSSVHRAGMATSAYPAANWASSNFVAATASSSTPRACASSPICR